MTTLDKSTYRKVPHSNPDYNYKGSTVGAYEVVVDGRVLGIVEQVERRFKRTLAWQVRGRTTTSASRKLATISLLHTLGL